MDATQQVQDRFRSLLSAEEVGHALGIDVSTVYRMAGDGRLPARKIGRQWRFPAEAVRPQYPPAALDPGLAHATIAVAADLLGVMLVVTDLEGRPLTPFANPCRRFTDAAEQDVEACLGEWREIAAGHDLGTRFRRSALGFDCAAAFVRSGDRLVGMVIAGGVGDSGGTHPLTQEGRERVLESLPRIAAAVAERRTS